jgi:anti-sigma factor RsiW
MNCGQFRQFYSDFTDGLLDEAEEVAFHVHMAECLPCRRFDAALEQGRSALRSLDRPSAAGDFHSRLYDRIVRENAVAEAATAEPVLRQFSGMAGAVLIVAMVSVVGWNVRSALRPAAPFRHADSTGLFATPLGADSGPGSAARRAADSLGLNRSQPREITTDLMTP